MEEPQPEKPAAPVKTSSSGRSIAKRGKATAEAVETIEAASEGVEATDIDPALLASIDKILASLNIQRVYFIDDAVNKQADLDTFLGLIQSLLAEGKGANLQAIKQRGIDFTNDEAVLIPHIRQVWNNLHPKTHINYFTKAYEIAGSPEAINDINVSGHLQHFFREGMLECLTPNAWDERRDEILTAIPADQRILLLIDQDLKMAEGRFSEEGIRGEHLIQEVCQSAARDRAILTLFTHTVQNHEEELAARQRICSSAGGLQERDFFVLTKRRLDQQDQFTDGLKKTCLNMYCEQIKDDTIAIVQEAQRRTIAKIKAFDTYQFDQAVFRSSFKEGVWEPETLLRLTDVIFKDEVRALMQEEEYITRTNNIVTAAQNVSNITVRLQSVKENNSHKYQLRHQELYEAAELLNPSRRAIDNGDIFKVESGSRAGQLFILLAQECDMMVRSEGTKKGERGSKTAVLARIEVITKDNLLKKLEKFNQWQIDKKNFSNHFFADRFRLNYFEDGTDKVGLVNFKDIMTADLDVLDLMVFHANGKSILDLNATGYNAAHHNTAWRERFGLIVPQFTALADELDQHYSALEAVADQGARSALKSRVNKSFSFIENAGIEMNYAGRRFDFGLVRMLRLRSAKAKDLLDDYYQYLSRFAEPHDFAG